MAERSKALVLGTSLLGGVGSNPTPINVNPLGFFNFSCALRLRKRKYVVCASISSELAQRKRVGLITQRSQDRNLDSLVSRLAQLVERKTLNLVVVGSSPTVGVSFIFYLFIFIFREKNIFLFLCNRVRVRVRVYSKRKFPNRESNPGRVGENHIS